MIFHSEDFAIFFAVVYGLYIATMRRLAVQNALLLAASYFFYGWWDWRLLGLLAFSTGVDYIAGALIDRRAEGGALRFAQRVRRSLLIISVGVNLGVLGLFKYFDFFSASASRILSALGWPHQPLLLNVVLPVGISFYTFQSLSYTIDVYRGQLRAERNPLNFALFISFFPQLVAGPIVRAVDFLPQVTTTRHLDPDRIFAGCSLFLWGLFKKAVVADNLALVADRVFSMPQTPSGGTVLVGVYAFAVQIYCDFSGYSDMARGLAKTMGFEFGLNFNLPYFATNPVEFWRRWHISLSTWLRDYLYVPLGGNRKGLARTYVNLALTMVLGGLWHGAAWTFVLWGAFQGAWLCLHRAFSTVKKPSGSNLLGRLAFLHLVCLGWLMFRAESVSQFGTMLAAVIVWPWTSLGSEQPSLDGGAATLLAYSLPVFFVEWFQYKRKDLDALLSFPSWIRGLSYSCMVYALILLGGRVGRPFIYFQF